jgi:hypothetical protein
VKVKMIKVKKDEPCLGIIDSCLHDLDKMCEWIVHMIAVNLAYSYQLDDFSYLFHHPFQSNMHVQTKKSELKRVNNSVKTLSKRLLIFWKENQINLAVKIQYTVN